uniref:Uncharacterized protein n=1 Tax=Opuntia streptacantha TaxID=393608 RepID=A0A7C9DH84_OPUST
MPPEGDQRPSETKQARISVGISDEFSPNHDENEPCHYTCWWQSFGPPILHFVSLFHFSIYSSIPKPKIIPLQIFTFLLSFTFSRRDIHPDFLNIIVVRISSNVVMPAKNIRNRGGT